MRKLLSKFIARKKSTGNTPYYPSKMDTLIIRIKYLRLYNVGIPDIYILEKELLLNDNNVDDIMRGKKDMPYSYYKILLKNIHIIEDKLEYIDTLFDANDDIYILKDIYLDMVNEYHCTNQRQFMTIFKFVVNRFILRNEQYVLIKSIKKYNNLDLIWGIDYYDKGNSLKFIDDKYEYNIYGYKIFEEKNPLFQLSHAYMSHIIK